jgi:hypothetical protein
METLDLVVSVTSRRTIVSKYVTDPLLVSVMALGDTLKGRVSVVQEVNDPTMPTTGVAVTAGRVAITDGLGVIYADASPVTIENGNDIVFTLNVAGNALTTAMTGVEYLAAMLEIRATVDGVDSIIANEAITIAQAVTHP